MKTTFFLIGLSLLIQTGVYAQWTNIDEPLHRRGSRVQYYYTGDDVIANTGLSIFRFNQSGNDWEYAGDNLFNQYPYRYFDNHFVWENQLFCSVDMHLMKYDADNNTWIEQEYTLPELMPEAYLIQTFSSTDEFVYIVLQYQESGINYFTIYYTTDFVTWNEGLTQEDVGLAYFRFRMNNHYIAWANENNDVLYSDDGETLDTLHFGSVPKRPAPDQWMEYLQGESIGDYIFYKGTDDRMYRYSISGDVWDTIQNNFLQPTFVIDFTVAQGLLICSTINGPNLIALGSNDGGQSFFPISGNMGPLPILSDLCYVGNNQYWLTSMLSDVLYSGNSGVDINIRNEGFTAGMNYIVPFDNKLYTFITGYGVSKADPENLEFEYDNEGTEPFIGILASDGLYSTGPRLYYSLIEDISNGAMGIYYKDDEASEWTRIDAISDLVGVRFLGSDNAGNLYLFLRISQSKDVITRYYRLSPELVLTELLNIPGAATGTGTPYNIIAGGANDLYYFYTNDEMTDKLYRSLDSGETWIELNMGYPNYTFVFDFRKIDGSFANVASLVNDAGELVFILRTKFGVPVTYENILLKYNLSDDMFTQLDASGFPQDMLYACSLGKSDGFIPYCVATNFGFFYSDSDLDNWMPDSFEHGYRTGMVPNGIVDLGNRIIVSTLCHGIWYSDFYNSIVQEGINNVGVFPNPAQKTISVMGLNAGDKVIVYNTQGVELMQFTAGTSSQSVNVESFEQGMYFIKVNHNNVERIMRFIKE
ncbi:MAG: T9SS type A sorting domain-containing protein [Bacteroidales bacterium]|nr:T9SS type A sorting domain-containing protein [Bacteroidales bacterium]HOY38955.1 T9SS type A sorting domain-containing protein [Bacteroidales bacterium]HQP03947.1 T9SS type A sorting domain-containing protein [Bacteroidales bacterium]